MTVDDPSTRSGRAVRLAIVVDSLSGGGAERITAGLAERLAALGWFITLITLSAAEGDVYRLSTKVKRIALNLQADSGGSIAAVRANVARVAALRRVLREVRPELLLGSMGTSAVLASLAALASGYRVIAWEHCDPRMSFADHKWDWIRALAYRRADAVVALTPSGVSWLRSRTLSRRVLAIPNPVVRSIDPMPPVLLPQEHVPPQRRLILAVGRLTRQKGFDLLLRAYAAVARRHPEWMLAVLGEGETRAQLESIIADLGLHGRVVMPGWAGNVGDWYRRADLFVLSSRWEGFPGALGEAMANGLAVVSFACQSGPDEMIVDGKDGILVAPEDAAALGEQMLRLVENPELRTALGAAAAGIADRFSPERVTQQWLDLAASLLPDRFQPHPP